MPRVKKLFVMEKKKKNNNNQLIILYQSLIESKSSYIDVFFKIILENKIKIIIIEYFITNYSKKHQIIIKDGDTNDFFYINDEYKNQLKSFNKKFFDPYKRNNKFELEHKRKKIITTVGQMNFFKWAIENKIIDYIIIHYKEIMVEYYKSKA
tara:strand:+ start:1237 stop:1692 length:456 start_codon:yes stop_codon:yes gene_type:complete